MGATAGAAAAAGAFLLLDVGAALPPVLEVVDIVSPLPTPGPGLLRSPL